LKPVFHVDLNLQPQENRKPQISSDATSELPDSELNKVTGGVVIVISLIFGAVGSLPSPKLR
jgi:hypothetical protein